MRLLATITLCALFLAPSAAVAQRKTDFCRGFDEGWKAVRGELALLPLCPLEPLTPLGSTSYREGLKAGVNAGNRSGGRRTGGATPRTANAQDDFCDGFAEGYKSIKGSIVLVPLCPLAPLTPLGSTPYREGVLAGMTKARRNPS